MQQNKYLARSEGRTAASVCLSVWASSPYQSRWPDLVKYVRLLCKNKQTNYLTNKVLLETLTVPQSAEIFTTLYGTPHSQQHGCRYPRPRESSPHRTVLFLSRSIFILSIYAQVFDSPAPCRVSLPKLYIHFSSCTYVPHVLPISSAVGSLPRYFRVI
jgi:hypothetical protein